jgi:asparagine synthase (glutamine-hydrolysing)
MLDTTDPVGTYVQGFVDRSHDALNDLLEPECRLPDDPSRAFVEEHFARPGRRRRWTARCGWTARSCSSTTR